MNPFNLTGWETVVATAIACSTAVACTVLGGRNLVQMTEAICDAIKEAADAYFNAGTGKSK